MELRQLVDAVPQQVFVLEADGRVLYANRRAREYTGLSLEDSRAPDIMSRLLHPDDLPRVLAEFEDAIARGVPMESELRWHRKDGQYRWFLTRLNPLRDQDGTIVRWYGTHTDIEDRKRAEDALRKSEEQWRHVFENNPTMYFMVNAEGRVLAVNPFGAEQLGYAVDELLGQSVLKVFHKPDLPEAKKHLARCLGVPGKSLSWELRNVRKDGSLLWVRETARAVLRGEETVVLIALRTSRSASTRRSGSGRRRWSCGRCWTLRPSTSPSGRRRRASLPQSGRTRLLRPHARGVAR